jgi:VWFA-related protein
MVRLRFPQLPVLIAFLFLASSVCGQTTPKNVSTDETLKLRAELVVVDVNVIDRKTREFIRSLKEQDFDLFEDDAKQRIEFFSQDKLPLSIVLLIDISPSVRPVIERVREGAMLALQRLKPEDEVALMSFSGWTELIQDFTRDRQLIINKVGEALDRKGGGTRIHEAIAKAARQMRYATNPNSRRVIVAITDNQGSMDRYRDAISEEEVRNTVMESGETVCGVIVRSLINVADAIIFQHPQIQEKSKRTSVNPYAEQTGGEIASSGKDEINARLGEMFDHLRSRYTIGYSSTNQNYNGKFRRIKLALSSDAKKRLGGQIAVTTRQGYYAVDRASEELLAHDPASSEKPSENRPKNHQAETADSTEAKTSPASYDKPIGVLEAQPAATTGSQPVTFIPTEPLRPPSPYSHLMMFDVHALNKKTGAVADKLAKEDFELNDNGLKREITHFSRGELPISMVLLIDVGGKTPYIMSALRRNVAGWLLRLKPEDEIALMGFGTTAALVQDFTRDRKLIAVGLRDFADIARQKGIGGGQDRTTAVFQAAEYMDKAANPIGRRVIIAVTDDSPLSYTTAESGATAKLLLDSGTVVYAMVTKGPRRSRKRQIVTAAAEGALFGLGNPISIITQIVTKMGSQAVIDALLRDRVFGQMVQKTGGTAVRIGGEDATEKLSMLLDRIHNRYVLGVEATTDPVVATSPSQAGSNYRPVRLTLTDDAKKRHGDLFLGTLHGYYRRLPNPTLDSNTTKTVRQDSKSPK